MNRRKLSNIDIKGDRIWVQHNRTEFDIADRLSEMGVPKKNILNGFHSSYMRQFTEFVVSEELAFKYFEYQQESSHQKFIRESKEILSVNPWV